MKSAGILIIIIVCINKVGKIGKTKHIILFYWNQTSQIEIVPVNQRKNPGSKEDSCANNPKQQAGGNLIDKHINTMLPNLGIQIPTRSYSDQLTDERMHVLCSAANYALHEASKKFGDLEGEGHSFDCSNHMKNFG